MLFCFKLVSLGKGSPSEANHFPYFVGSMQKQNRLLVVKTETLPTFNTFGVYR